MQHTATGSFGMGFHYCFSKQLTLIYHNKKGELQILFIGILCPVPMSTPKSKPVWSLPNTKIAGSRFQTSNCSRQLEHSLATAKVPRIQLGTDHCDYAASDDSALSDEKPKS